MINPKCHLRGARPTIGRVLLRPHEHNIGYAVQDGLMRLFYESRVGVTLDGPPPVRFTHSFPSPPFFHSIR